MENFKENMSNVSIFRSLCVMALVALLSVSCGQSNSAADGESEVYSETLSFSVSGAASDSSCTVYGNEGRLLGSGDPELVSYEYGAEEMMVVTCGELSAVAEIGLETVALTEATTEIATEFLNVDMIAGTLLMAKLMSNLDDENENFSLNFSQNQYLRTPLNAKKKKSDVVEKAQSAMKDFIKAVSDLDKASTSTSYKRNLIKVLVATGQPVLIEEVGKGKIIDNCTEKEAQKHFSTDATVIDAQAIDMDGCLVYHKLDSVTDKNNPKNIPANNVPDSFRSLIKETGVLQTLVDIFNSKTQKYFTIQSLLSHIFTTIGHQAHVEDDEGVVTDVVVNQADLSDYVKDFLSLELDNWDSDTDRFHTGYNPTGGRVYDVVAEDWGDDEWSDDCYDWTGDALASCPLTAKKYDFDGTTLLENVNGEYVLQLEWRGDGFIDDVTVVNSQTSIPYRDSNYQPVAVKLSDNGMDAGTVNTIYFTNHFNILALDPMEDSDGVSAPYSSSDWTDLFPEMSPVANAYVYPKPEIAGKLAVLIHKIVSQDRLDALQAYSLFKMLTHGLAALELKDSSYAIINDHDLTLSNWESATQKWLQSGTSLVNMSGDGKMDIDKDGKVVMSLSHKCKISGGGKESCTVTETNLLIDKSSKQTAEDGVVTYQVSGQIEFLSDTFGSDTYSPTSLQVNSKETIANFIGDADLELYYRSKKITDKIDGKKSQKATFIFNAIND